MADGSCMVERLQNGSGKWSAWHQLPQLSDAHFGAIQQEIGCGDQLRWQRRRMQLRSSKRALGVKPALGMLIFADFTALGVH